MGRPDESASPRTTRGSSCRMVMPAFSCSTSRTTGASEPRLVAVPENTFASLDGNRVVNGPRVFDRDLREIASVTIPGVPQCPYQGTGISGDAEISMAPTPKGFSA